MNRIFRNMGGTALKYILAVVVALIIGTVYFITRPQPAFVAGKSSVPVTPIPVAPESEQVEQTNPEIMALEARREAMSVAFEELKKARRNLESRLARMKAVAWGVELPKAEADVINEQMKQGYALLKNQRLMGAYSNAEEISNERASIEFINENLKTVEERFRAQRVQ